MKRACPVMEKFRFFRALIFFLASCSGIRVSAQVSTATAAGVVQVSELSRTMPHDVVYALCALATAVGAGASLEGCRRGLLAFRGLPRRVELVGDVGVQIETALCSRSAGLAVVKEVPAAFLAQSKSVFEAVGHAGARAGSV